MRLAILIVGIVLAAGVLWLAGRSTARTAKAPDTRVARFSRGTRAIRPKAVAPVPKPEDVTRLFCLRYNAGLRRAGVTEAHLLDCSRSPAR
jgi:hypothetical protein